MESNTDYKKELKAMTDGLDEWCEKRERRRVIKICIVIVAGTAVLSIGGFTVFKYVVSKHDEKSDDRAKIELFVVGAPKSGSLKTCWVRRLFMPSLAPAIKYQKRCTAYRPFARKAVPVVVARRRVSACHMRRGIR